MTDGGSGRPPVDAAAHVPVLLAEMLDALAPVAGRTYVDATYGDGGTSRALLDAGAVVLAIDRDPEATERARDLARQRPALAVIEGRFGDMATLAGEHGHVAGSIAGVALDLGVSSRQLNDPARGFSFLADGPLDMRMDAAGPTAADVVNDAPVEDLASILRSFGDERHARRVARAIDAARRTAPLMRTGELAALVAASVPPERRRSRGSVTLHPATRAFQALRMFVNDEIGELRRGLVAAERLLMPEGRLAAVSFHSIEDREVKRFLMRRAGHAPRPSRHTPPAIEVRPPSFRLPARGAIRPSATEVRRNLRARSARLRWASRTAAPAWGREEAA